MIGRRILGLDIGSYSAKAVEIDARLRRVEFLRFEQVRIPPDASPEEREATLQLFLDQHDFPHEFVACAMPTDRVTQRHLRFPFSGEKRIAQAIPFELEEQLPFPLDGMVVTHEQVLARPEQSDVLVVLSPHAAVRDHLETLRRLGIEPRILEVEGAVLANVCAYLDLADAGRLVLEVGHAKTNLCLLVDGRPVVLRSIPIAGHHFTEAIAKDFGLSYEAAEQRKHEHGIFEAGTTRPISPSLGSLLDQLSREAMRSVQSVVGDPLDTIAPGEIVLAGGSANLEGLALHFEEDTGLPCVVLNASSARSGAEALDEAGAATFAQAVALALRGSTSERATRLDLRRDEFQYVPDLSGSTSQLRLALLLFLVGLVLWPFSLWSHVLAERGRVETLRESLRGVCTQTFPRADCSGDPYKVMREEFRKTRELADHLGVTGTGLSAMEVMRELSQRIPRSLDISLSELKIERHSLVMRGHARDLETVGRMKKALAAFDWFESVPDPSTQRDPREGGQSFSLTIKFREES